MKKTTMRLFALSLFGLLSNTLIAQNLQSGAVQMRNANHPEQQLTPSGHIKCYTNENEAFLKATYPNRATTEEFENWLAPQIEKIKTDRLAGRNIQAVYNIPVVIHIIHNGDAVGTGENITNAQARSQIKVMNEDFRKMTSTRGGANTTGLAVDVEINFVLATIDPSGNPTTGIVRHMMLPPGGSASWDSNPIVETMKNSTSWNPNNYLNMWTCRFGGTMGGVLGYAQFPTGSGLSGIPSGATGAGTDGVIASYDAFGTLDANDGTFMLNSTYFLGRTMTHEVGHWLGLRHIWGDNSGCTVDATDSNKDYCLDTPAASVSNFGCPSGANSCAAVPGNDMIQNYMDYTDDSCMDTFTGNQKARMQTVMGAATRRATLNTSPALTPPAIPYVLLDYNTDYTIEKTNCTYTDIDVTLSINKAPTTNVNATFNVTGGTSLLNSDYQILNPSVVFLAGQLSYKKITIRVFNDSFLEGDETITGNITLTGGNAQLYTANNAITFTIKNNDTAIATTVETTQFLENFDPQANALVPVDLDGDTKNWGVYLTNANATNAGFNGQFAGSASWTSATGGLYPDNLLKNSTPIALPTITAGENLKLSFGIGSSSSGYFAEHYAVYVTTSNANATIIGSTPVYEATLSAVGRNNIEVSLNAFAGQNVYVTFRHFNTYDMLMLLLDDIRVYKIGAMAAQTNVNTATAYQVIIPGAGLTHTYDTVNGKIMASITSDAFNYGCTSTVVSRDQTTAGAAAVAYNGNSNPSNFVMAKTITVTPATNNASGNPAIKFYFTETEIAAWEAATGKNRSALRIIKNGVIVATTIGTYLPNTTLEGTFANGLNGVYYFGSDSSVLDNAAFELSDTVSIYPNPTKDILNINISSGAELPTSYTIFNSIGQMVKKVDAVSEKDLTISTSSYSNGLYFIKIVKDGSSTTKKFIKN